MRYLLLSLLILIGFSADINAQRPRRFSPDKQFVHDPVVACENGIYYVMTCNTVITPTALENATSTVKATKVIENGQMIIIRDGKRYNAVGAKL